jgi:hypothetical protein
LGADHGGTGLLEVGSAHPADELIEELGAFLNRESAAVGGLPAGNGEPVGN